MQHYEKLKATQTGQRHLRLTTEWPREPLGLGHLDHATGVHISMESG